MQIVPIVLLLVSVTTAAPTADFGVLHRLQKRAPVCYAANLASYDDLSSQECVAAIDQIFTTRMPGVSPNAGTAASMDVDGQFSNSAPEGSPFKLPRHFQSGRCTVGVTMVSSLPHHSESSSWNQIYRNTAELVRECVTRPTSLGRGGVTKAGRADGILIEVLGLMILYPPRVGFHGSTAPESV